MVLVVQNLPANAGEIRDSGWVPGVGKIPWRRKWQPTPVSLLGESHGQRSLMGYSPWDHSQTWLKQLNTHALVLEPLYPTECRIESESEVSQSCLTLCDPINCSLPGSSVHGIFQAIVLEWIAISFSNVECRMEEYKLGCQWPTGMLSW